MSFLDAIGAIAKYAALANQAVHEAEAQVGPGNGTQKKQVAVAYTLAAAHAGETVGVDKVAQVAAAVDLAVGVANMLGAFGPVRTTPVTVPAQAATAAGGQ